MDDGGANPLQRRFLQLRTFLWHDRTLHRTDLQTNPAINAGGKINPVPSISRNIRTRSRMNAGNGTGIHAIGNAFAGVCNNGMWHRISL